MCDRQAQWPSFSVWIGDFFFLHFEKWLRGQHHLRTKPFVELQVTLPKYCLLLVHSRPEIFYVWQCEQLRAYLQCGSLRIRQCQFETNRPIRKFLRAAGVKGQIGRPDLRHREIEASSRFRGNKHAHAFLSDPLEFQGSWTGSWSRPCTISLPAPSNRLYGIHWLV